MTDYNNAQWKPEINFGRTLQTAQTFLLEIQKDIIRNSTGYKSIVWCTDLFKHFKILLLQSQYLLPLLLFVINNENKFTLNSDVCNINIMT